MVIGPSLHYKDKVSGVCCMMFIDSYDDDERVNGIEIPEHSSGSELFFSLLNNKQEIDEI
jgi:hypothetical protein